MTNLNQSEFLKRKIRLKKSDSVSHSARSIGVIHLENLWSMTPRESTRRQSAENINFRNEVTPKAGGLK